MITGLLVNRDHRIWDYRDRRGNILGQICPLFTALWIPVTVAAMGLYRGAEGLLEGSQKGKCRES